MTDTPTKPLMALDTFDNTGFSRGASKLTELMWIVMSGLLFSSWLPGSGWRCALLRLFGANVGQGVVIKPRVSVKFPWRLHVGEHVWIGERVWIDNLADVHIGNHSCLSQGAFLCTGSHNWSEPSFSLITKPISVGSGCWICAKAVLTPGVVVEDGAVLAMSAIATGHVQANTIQFADGSTRPRKQMRKSVPE